MSETLAKPTLGGSSSNRSTQSESRTRRGPGQEPDTVVDVVRSVPRSELTPRDVAQISSQGIEITGDGPVTVRRQINVSQLQRDIASSIVGTDDPIAIRSQMLLTEIAAEVGGEEALARIQREQAVDQQQLNNDASRVAGAAFDIVEAIVIGIAEESGVSGLDEFKQVRGRIDDAEAGSIVIETDSGSVDVVRSGLRSVVGPLVGESIDPGEIEVGKRFPFSDATGSREAWLDGLLEEAGERATLIEGTRKSNLTQNEDLSFEPDVMKLTVPARGGGTFTMHVPIERGVEVLRRVAEIKEQRAEDAVHAERQRIEELQREEIQRRDDEDEESRGKCDCPSDRDSAGKRCGNRCAWVRSGGRKPSCNRDISGKLKSAKAKIENELERISLRD